MKVLVVGSGAREHALVWKLAVSDGNLDIYCAPGNAGTGLPAQNVEMPISSESQCEQLAGWAFDNGIGLAIVGPEVPLSFGMADSLMMLGVPVLGPTQAAARIETSKAWARDFMRRRNIPSPDYSVEVGLEAIIAKLRDPATKYPLVMKADGLAGGKGAGIVQDALEGAETIAQMQASGALPAEDAAKKIVFESYLQGVEVSALAFTDGERTAMMPPVCDYKRLLEGDQGPMTGGMGAYTPTRFVTPDLWRQVEEEVIRRTVQGLAGEGITYRGVLYAGLMLTEEGPKVLEFNCRFGDPETQVLMPLLQTPLEEIGLAIAAGDLSRVGEISWSDKAAVGVVLASSSYPLTDAAPTAIQGLDDLEAGALVFHAATKSNAVTAIQPQQGSPKRSLFSSIFSRSAHPLAVSDHLDFAVKAVGGRILTVVGCAPTLAEARAAAYRTVDRIKIEGAQSRGDIAEREL